MITNRELQSERLVLRLPCEADLLPYTRYCESTRSKFVGGPFDSIQAFDKLSAMIGHWHLRGFGRFIFVERATNKQLGHVGALQPDTREHPELTWTIWNGADEKKGYAIEACETYCGYALRELGIQSAIARIHSENAPSIRLAEKMGGKLNANIPAPPWFPDSEVYEIDLKTRVRI